MDDKSTGRHILLHGLSMGLVGLFWGLAVPETPFPRIALSAHIQFMVNGLVFMLLALVVLNIHHGLGSRSLFALRAAAWLAWPMLLAATANAWWGTNELLPLAAQQAGATGGEAWQEAIVTLTHVVGGTSLILAWGLLLIGIAKNKAA